MRSLLILLAFISSNAFAQEATSVKTANKNKCEVLVESNDNMQFLQEKIEISKSCDTVKITLKHLGTLPKTTMGHNLVIIPDSGFPQIANKGMEAGIEKEYIPDDSRIVAYTKLIGGGEEASIELKPAKLAKDTNYIFLCLFPGHFALMRGDVKIID